MNMKLKSTLWALAFACAAVSCSDELEEGGNGTGIIAEDGEGVYVSVNVSTSAGPMSKAGELGNGDLEDSDAESAVHDVNIFLVPVTPGADYSGITANDISYVNAAETTTIYSGYSTDVQAATGNIPHHDLEATVRVSVPDLNEWYHVLTVVNAGDDLGFTTIGQLRDYLQEKVWQGDNEYAEDGTGAHNFVMSTHQMWQQEAGGSDLYVTADNTDPNNPAETTVYVERLAARIDLNLASGLTTGTKPVDETGAELSTNDQVKITGYQVINQMIGGTYMLKRVTKHQSTTAVDGAIPTDGVVYIGDEIWQEGAYNYVIDPWTLNKKQTTNDGATSFPEAIYNSGAYYSGTSGNYTQTVANDEEYTLATELYTNHFWEGLNSVTDFMNFADIPADIKTTEGQFTPLLYVQENTADASQQKKGFTTGVIFEGTYKPEHLSQYSETDGKVSNEITYTEGSPFLVADYKHTTLENRKLSADLRTIAVLGFNSTAQTDVIKYIFNEGNKASLTNATEENFRSAVNGMSGGPLVDAFQGYLQSKLTGTFNDVKADLTWDAFVAASKTSDDIAYVPTDEELTSGIAGNPDGEDGKTAIKVREELMDNYNIAYYDGGKCYYKYWIKHEPLNDDKKMGVMEFAIVRNNVYQLAVTGVTGLGDPLPFTPGEDDPDDPVKEQEEVRILVRLYVRNWVKRTNSDILL